MFFNKKSFKVKITGRAGLIYQENGKSLEVDSEMLGGPEHDIVIYKQSIERWSDDELINDMEKEHILQNLKTHFESQKYKVDIA